MGKLEKGAPSFDESGLIRAETVLFVSDVSAVSEILAFFTAREDVFDF